MSVKERSIPEFDGEDYPIWSARMRLLLQREKVYHIVRDPVPSARNRTEEWQDQNALAMHLIASHLSNRYFRQVGSEVFAHTMWATLSSEFNRTSYLQIADLREEIRAMKYNLSDSISIKAYVVNYRSKVYQLKSLNAP